MSQLMRIRGHDLSDGLSDALKSALSGREILLAWGTPDRERIVLWLVKHAIRNSIEVEWSESRGRLLGNAERAEQLADSTYLDLADLGCTVQRSEYLADQTDRLSERFLVRSPVAEFAEFTCSQAIYSPVRLAAQELVGQQLRIIRFPSVYAQWPRDDKVKYWTQYLYRGRRMCGENGQDEDVAFGPDVVAHMKTIDPEIHTLLPKVLQRLARMDQLDPKILADAFSTRTGCLVTLTPASET